MQKAKQKAVEAFIDAADYLINKLATEITSATAAKHADDLRRGYERYHAARIAVMGDEVGRAGEDEDYIPMD